MDRQLIQPPPPRSQSTPGLPRTDGLNRRYQHLAAGRQPAPAARSNDRNRIPGDRRGGAPQKPDNQDHPQRPRGFNRLYLIPALLVIAAFLLPGYWLGMRIAEKAHTPAGPEALAAALPPMPTLDNGQRTILLINVTDLKADTVQLNSVWLISYFLPSANITLLPLYPTSSDAPVEAQLADAFSFTEDHNGIKPNPNFLAVLQQKDIWWSGYLVLDETIFAQVIDALNGITLSGVHMTGSEAVEMLNLAEAGGHPPLARQTTLLQDICWNISALAFQPDWAVFKHQVGSHILTDLDPTQVLSDWLTMLGQPGNLTCEFPMTELHQSTGLQP